MGPKAGVGNPFGGGPGAAGPAAAGLTVLTLKHAQADEMGKLLRQVVVHADITADARTNQLIVRADAKTLDELKELLIKLDVPVPQPKR
jgi:type II secretory pathway component GspD/PulD (secretin)